MIRMNLYCAFERQHVAVTPGKIPAAPIEIYAVPVGYQQSAFSGICDVAASGIRFVEGEVGDEDIDNRLSGPASVFLRRRDRNE